MDRLSLLRRPAAKLSIRIYLFGLVQLALLMLGMFIILALSHRPPLQFASVVDYLSATVVSIGGNRREIAAVLARVRSTLNCSVAVYDQADQLVAHDPAATAPQRRADATLPDSDLTASLAMPDGSRWHLVFLAQPPITRPPVLMKWIPLIIIGVGVTSLFMARSLVRPLTRLAEAARELGSGKMNVRLNMRRSDELGQLAAAFDQMADRMRHALRVEKELLANVSHELRTPLQRIHIAVELAAEGDADTAHESLRDIAEDLGELERIVEDVLTATRLSLSDGGGVSASASPPIRPELLDVRVLIDKSTARFRGLHPRRPLAVAVADDIPAVAADPVLLRRVFDNLLDNAHKYTEDADSEINLSASFANGRVRVDVRDHGIGIAADDLARIFEPFFRADRSRTKTTGGLGLGLALCRRIIEAHDGTLTVESNFGSGTHARVDLPVA